MSIVMTSFRKFRHLHQQIIAPLRRIRKENLSIGCQKNQKKYFDENNVEHALCKFAKTTESKGISIGRQGFAKDQAAQGKKYVFVLTVD